MANDERHSVAAVYAGELASNLLQQLVHHIPDYGERGVSHKRQREESLLYQASSAGKRPRAAQRALRTPMPYRSRYRRSARRYARRARRAGRRGRRHFRRFARRLKRGYRRLRYRRPSRGCNTALPGGSRMVKWNCSYHATVNPAATTNYHRIDCNSADPFGGLNARQPYGYDQLSTFYNTVWDRAMHVTFSITNLGGLGTDGINGTGVNTAHPLEFTMYQTRGAEGAPGSADALVEHKGCKLITVPSGQTRKGALFVKLKGAYTGRNTWQDTEFSHAFGANPTEYTGVMLALFQHGYVAAASFANLYYILDVNCCIYSRLSNAVDVASS